MARRVAPEEEDGLVRVKLVPNERNGTNIVASISLVISFLALLASAATVLITWDHNRRSVRPKINVHRELRHDQEQWGLYLEGAGTGPAVVAAVSIGFKGLSLDQDQAWRSAFLYLRNEGTLGTKIPVWREFDKGDHILPERRLELFVTSRENVRDAASFRRFLLEDLVVKVHYCSLYNEAHCVRSDGRACRVEDAADLCKI